MTKNYIIAPTHDVDSLVSHAVGEIWQPGVEHRSLEYKAENIPFEDLSVRGDQHIVISDLGNSDSDTNARMVELLGNLRVAGTIVDFYDQHNWPIKKTGIAFDTYISRDDISSAEIMARELVPDNQIAMYLAGLATLDDYNRPNPQSENLKDIVNSGFPSDRLYLELARLEQSELILSHDAQTALSSYRHKRDEALETLAVSYKTHETPIGTFATGFAPAILYMKPGHRAIRDDHPNENMICFYGDLQNVTFRTQTPEQMTRLLSIFKGGGRDTEGGFDPGAVVNEENYTDVRDDVIDKIRTL